MGLFDFFRTPDINEEVRKARESAGAILLDVRTEEEFSEGHIEGSVNLPLDRITSVGKTVKDKSTPLYVFCYSGSRSSQAVAYLKKAGYTDVTNIGGIIRYKGELV